MSQQWRTRAPCTPQCGNLRIFYHVKSILLNFESKTLLFYEFWKLLTPSLNFRHQFFSVKVSTQRWHTPRVLQMCPLTSLVKYFGSDTTMASSRGLQSWKKGSFLCPLDNLAGYLEPRLDQILVGWFVLYPQELNPARYELNGLR